MSTTAIWQVVDETAKLAGVGHVKPHDLRRSLAIDLLETGAPVFTSSSSSAMPTAPQP